MTPAGTHPDPCKTLPCGLGVGSIPAGGLSGMRPRTWLTSFITWMNKVIHVGVVGVLVGQA